MPKNMRLEEFCEVGQVLGQGNYGIVRSCVPVRSEGLLQAGRIVACKTIKQETIRSDVECRAVRTELEVMELARGHPQIVNLEHVHKDELGIHIFMEMCDLDLFTELKKKGSFPEGEIKSIFKQLLNAVAFLHRNGIVHRDLKLDNVLLIKQSSVAQLIGNQNAAEQVFDLLSPMSEASSMCSSATDFDMDSTFAGSEASCELDPEIALKQQSASTPEMRVKLTDFGLAKFVGDIQCSEIAGSPFYLAPEVLKLIIAQRTGLASRSRLQPYGTAMDVWSLGVILYSLFTGRFPYSGQSPMDLYRAIKGGTLNFEVPAFKCVSPEAKKLIQKLLTEDVSARPQIQDILDDPWFVGKPLVNFLEAGTVLKDSKLPAAQEVCKYLTELELVKKLHPSGPDDTHKDDNFPIPAIMDPGIPENVRRNQKDESRSPPRLKYSPRSRVPTPSLWVSIVNKKFQGLVKK